MPFTLAPLPYASNAMEPHIDAQTMEIHHGKHHQAYVNNLNKALEGTPFENKSIEEIVGNLAAIPDEKRGAVRNNGGGHWNHTFFWNIIGWNAGGKPSEPSLPISKRPSEASMRSKKNSLPLASDASARGGLGWSSTTASSKSARHPTKTPL